MPGYDFFFFETRYLVSQASMVLLCHSQVMRLQVYAITLSLCNGGD